MITETVKTCRPFAKNRKLRKFAIKISKNYVFRTCTTP